MENTEFTPAEAAEYLGVTVQTLANWRFQDAKDGGNRLPFTECGRRILYHGKNLLQWKRMDLRSLRSTTLMLPQWVELLLVDLRKETGQSDAQLICDALRSAYDVSENYIDAL